MNNKKRTELMEKRSANVKVFENADHSRTAEIYLDAVHFQDENGNWKEMDDTLTETDSEDIKEGTESKTVEENKNSDSSDNGDSKKEKGFSNKKGNFQFKMKKHSREKGMFTLKKGDVQLSWGLEGAAKVIGEKEDGEKVRYLEIMKDTDLVCRVRGERVKEDIVLTSPEAGNEVSYLYELKGVGPVQRGNCVVFIKTGDADESGSEDTYEKECFRVAAPYMEDAAGVRSEAVKVILSEADEKGKSCRITFIADKAWLGAPERVYPVTVDPVTTTSMERTDIQDAHVDSLYEEDNFRNSIILKTKGGSHVQRSFVRFLLPEMKTGDMVVNARFVLASYAEDGKERSIAVHKVLGSWDHMTINWNNKPIYEEIVQDICRYTADKAKFITFDITRMVKDWYQNGNNYGLMFKDEYEHKSNYTEYQSADNDNDFENQRPRIEISYMNYSGLEDYWTYHTQNVGRAGTVYVNDYNGNLILVHDTVTMAGNLMPAVLSHVYNTNNMTEDIGYGYGFRLNYHQTLNSVTIAGTQYYKHIDENGTVHYFFKDTDNIWKDEAITDRTLTVNSGGTFTIKDKKNNQLIFNSSGYLTTVKDNSGVALTITYSNKRISKIKDGAGRELVLNYAATDGVSRLSSISIPGNRTKSFTYSSGRLHKVTDVDGKIITYTYSSKRILRVINVDGSYVTYDYHTVSGPYRVKSITEYGTDGTKGNSLSIEYGYNSTKYTDNKGRSEVYRFNNMGNLIHIHDGFGHAAGAGYHVSGNHVNCLKNTTKLQDNVIQLLKNPAMLNGGSGWTGLVSSGNTGASTVNTDVAHCMIGSKSLRCYNADISGYARWTQNVKIKKGVTYTASMYVKAVVTTPGTGGAVVRIRYKDSEGKDVYLDSEYLRQTTDGFVRLHVTFTIPEDAQSDTVVFFLVMRYAVGTAYGDMAQLEAGDTPNRCNLIDNGEFHLGKIGDFVNDNDAEDSLASVNISDRVPFVYHMATIKSSVSMYGKAVVDASDVVATLGKDVHVAAFASLNETLSSGDTRLWYHVKLENGTTGYIQSSDLSIYVSGGDTMINGVVAAVGQELMGSASSTGTYVKWDVPQHCPISVISNKKDTEGKTWYRVGLTIDNIRYTGYLPTEAVARFYGKEYQGTLSAADSLYSRPSLSGSVLRSYDSGAQVIIRGTVLDASGTEWYAVQNGMVFGYLHHRYVTCGESMAVKKRNLEKVEKGVSGLDGNIFRFCGQSNIDKKLTKTLNMTGGKGDTYTVNAWGKGISLPETDNDKDRRFGVEVVFVDTANKKEDVHYTNFSPDLLDWQFLCDVYVAKHAYDKVKVSYTYCHQANTAYFDGLSLFREEFGQTYTYDEDNNIISVVDNQKNSQEFEYDDKDDMTGVTDAKGSKFTYTYDDSHRVTQGVSAEGVKYKFVYDEEKKNGNLIKSGVFDPSNAAKGTWITRTMTSDDNHVSTVTDTEGSTVSYAWDLSKDEITSLTDGKGNKLSYTYDTLGHLTKVSQQITVNGTAATVANEYAYKDNDLLKTITHNGFDYGFTYDVFGNTKAVSIAGSNVVDYEYAAKNGNLTKTEYKNGAYISYEYDAQDRLLHTYYSDSSSGTKTALNSYVYDKQGNLAKVTNHPSDRTYYLSYDFLDRLMRVHDDAGNIYEYTYDVNNQMIRMKHVNASGSAATDYTYDKDGRETAAAVRSSIKRNTYYDKFGRVTSQQWNASGLPSAIYTYPSSGNNHSTRPNTMRIGKRRLDYTYDANGNITKIVDNTLNDALEVTASVTDTYVYDERNQLIRENSKSQNRTFVYAYDIGGNLTSIKEYDHTNSTPGTPLSTINAGYDSVWKDMMVSWNGRILEYDDIGNLCTQKLGDVVERTYTWTQGRKLAGVSENGMTAQYAYDHTGMRMKKTVTKTVNGTATTAETAYSYAGSLLLSETTGSNNICYHYDSSANLIAMSVKGTLYFYVKNLQRDIIGMIDTSGKTVVEYTYDSWGKLLSITGSLKDTVGVQNPFRYRGYYYDTETGMYYLQSRYYDSEIRRFISADDIINRTMLGGNVFCYCENNPIVKFDLSGHNPAIAIHMWELAKYAVAGIISIATSVVVNQSSVKQAGKNLVNIASKKIIQSQTITINDWIDDYRNRVKADTIARLDAKRLLNKNKKNTHIHHIVAQNAPMANSARNVLYNAGLTTEIDANKVPLSQTFHASLHTHLYYGWVNLQMLYIENNQPPKSMKGVIVDKLNEMGNTLQAWDRLFIN